MATGTELLARIDELKQKQHELAEQQRALIEDAVPEIVGSILEQIEILNAHNTGDKYSLKRGIYNVDDPAKIRERKTGTAMGQAGL